MQFRPADSAKTKCTSPARWQTRLDQKAIRNRPESPVECSREFQTFHCRNRRVGCVGLPTRQRSSATDMPVSVEAAPARVVASGKPIQATNQVLNARGASSQSRDLEIEPIDCDRCNNDICGGAAAARAIRTQRRSPCRWPAADDCSADFPTEVSVTGLWDAPSPLTQCPPCRGVP